MDAHDGTYDATGCIHDTKYVTEYDTTHAHSVTGCTQGVLSVTEVLHVGSTTPRVLHDARDVCSDV